MLTLLIALAMGQQDNEPTGRVVAATVYPQQATVVRQVDRDLQPGLNEIVFRDLPANIDLRSLAASGEGGAMIRGLSVRRVELAEDRRARVSELEARIATLGDERQQLLDDQTAAQTELDFLRKLSAAGAGQLSAELLFAPDTTSDADALATLLRRRTAAALDAVRQAAIAQRAIDASLAALGRELAQVRGAAQWARHEVSVEVSAEAAGPAAVRLEYNVPGASWTPLYDARGTIGEPTLDLVLSAQVVQTTGEDWSGAALTLSTAQPSLGVTAPELEPFWLYEQHAGYAYGRGAGVLNAPVMVADEMDFSVDDGESISVGRVAAAPMLLQEAEVEERAVATTFVVPGGSSVAGDGTSRRVQVTSVELPAEWSHVAVPMLDARAWRVAEITWTPGWSALAGEVNLFSDDRYVGSMWLAPLGTGGEAELGFGPDDAVTVERTVVEDLRRGPGFLRRPSVTRQWRTAIHNGHNEPIELSVRDRLPVSTVAAWKVEPLGDVADEQLDEGLLRWERTLAPDGSLELTNGWQVRYPKKNVPGGL